MGRVSSPGTSEDGTSLNGPIGLIGLGGTIAMTAGQSGLAPGLSLADLARPIGRESPKLRVREMASTASANLGFDDLIDVAREIATLRAEGAEGVVVVQGTDSLEETAFALELLTGRQTPIVFTGAMRAASQAGADGPANLANAVTVARSGVCAAGVLVVMNDEIHAARYVTKTHTTALDAFSSGDEGPIGRIHESRARLLRSSLPDLGVHPLPRGGSLPKVALIKVAMGQDRDLLDALPRLGYRGCVIEAMGAGHVPASLVQSVQQLAEQMPVVLCSRTGRGRICEATYGYAGSETDLLSRGLVGAGALGGLKARVALTILLARPEVDPNAAFRAIVQRI
ncbi:MAG TPA: asparaginase [Caulobacteraceae bacterium]|nr:asparaginase [Caulobacteraceae bacterium]